MAPQPDLSGYCCSSASSSSSIASSSSSLYDEVSSRRRPAAVVPLHQRFNDIPEPLKTCIIDSTTQLIQDNVRRYVRRNLDHINHAPGRARCSSCIVELERAVEVAEGTGVEVKKEHKYFLQDLHDEEQWVRWEHAKRKRKEPYEMQEEINRTWKKFKDDILALEEVDEKELEGLGPDYYGEEEDPEEEPQEDDEDEKTTTIMKGQPRGGGHGCRAWAIVKEPEQEEEPMEEEEEEDDDDLTIDQFIKVRFLRKILG